SWVSRVRVPSVTPEKIPGGLNLPGILHCYWGLARSRSRPLSSLSIKPACRPRSVIVRSMKPIVATGDSLPVEGGNTIPPAYDLLWAGLAVAWVALLATALILLFKDQNTSRAALLWFLAILVFRILGSVAYLVTRGQRNRQHR